MKPSRLFPITSNAQDARTYLIRRHHPACLNGAQALLNLRFQQSQFLLVLSLLVEEFGQGSPNHLSIVLIAPPETERSLIRGFCSWPFYVGNGSVMQPMHLVGVRRDSL